MKINVEKVLNNIQSIKNNRKQQDNPLRLRILAITAKESDCRCCFENTSAGFGSSKKNPKNQTQKTMELLRNKFGTNSKYIITVLCKSMMDLSQILTPYFKKEN